MGYPPIADDCTTYAFAQGTGIGEAPIFIFTNNFIFDIPMGSGTVLDYITFVLMALYF